MNINEKLAKITAEEIPNYPQEAQRLLEEGNQEILKNHSGKKARDIGDIAPEFTLFNTNGHHVSLSDYLSNGKTIIVFYRGEWCRYCYTYLNEIEEYYSRFTEARASVIAITPQTEQHAAAQKEKQNLSFDILIDTGNKVAELYGLKTPVPKSHIDLLASLDMPLDKINGNEGKDSTPIAATYLLDETGKIIWSFINPDYRLRGEPQHILDVLETFE